MDYPVEYKELKAGNLQTEREQRNRIFNDIYKRLLSAGTINEDLVTKDYLQKVIADLPSGGGGGGAVDSVVSGTGISVDSSDPANPEVSISDTTVTAGSYGVGSTNTVVNFVVNAQGQLTSAGTNLIDIDAAQVSGQLNTSQFADGSVTDAKLRNSNALSVIGRPTNTSGDPQDIVASVTGTSLTYNGTSLGFGAINLANSDATAGALIPSRGGTGTNAPVNGSILVGNGLGSWTQTTPATFLNTLDALASTRSASTTFSGPLFETGTISITLASNTSNWAPTGFASCNIIRLTASAAINLSGIGAGTAGRRITLMNVGTNTVTILHNSTSTAANQFLCPGSVNFSLTANKCVDLWYDTTSSRWRIIG